MIYSGQDLLALESQLAAANQHISQLEAELKNQQTPPPTSDPKAAEAMAALVELAKALKLVAA